MKILEFPSLEEQSTVDFFHRKARHVVRGFYGQDRPEVAEDLAQEGLIKACEKLCGGGRLENTGAWLGKVYTRRLIDLSRSENRRPEHVLLSSLQTLFSDPDASPIPMELSDPHPGPDMEDRIWVSEALEMIHEKLTDRQHTIFALGLFGLTQRRIAELLDLSPAAINAEVKKIELVIRSLWPPDDGGGGGGGRGARSRSTWLKRYHAKPQARKSNRGGGPVARIDGKILVSKLPEFGARLCELPLFDSEPEAGEAINRPRNLADVAALVGCDLAVFLDEDTDDGGGEGFECTVGDPGHFEGSHQDYSAHKGLDDDVEREALRWKERVIPPEVFYWNLLAGRPAPPSTACQLVDNASEEGTAPIVLKRLDIGGAGWSLVGMPPLGDTERDHFEERIIAKFYRPGIWSAGQILEEHRFLQEMDAEEIPVGTVRPFPDGETLHTIKGIYYALFDRRGGHAPDELTDAMARRLGMLVGRLHNVGARRSGEPRLQLTADTFIRDNLRWLKEHCTLPDGGAVLLHRNLNEVFNRHLLHLADLGGLLREDNIFKVTARQVVDNASEAGTAPIVLEHLDIGGTGWRTLRRLVGMTPPLGDAERDHFEALVLDAGAYIHIHGAGAVLLHRNLADLGGLLRIKVTARQVVDNASEAGTAPIVLERFDIGGTGWRTLRRLVGMTPPLGDAERDHFEALVLDAGAYIHIHGAGAVLLHHNLNEVFNRHLLHLADPLGVDETGREALRRIRVEPSLKCGGATGLGSLSEEQVPRVVLTAWLLSHEDTVDGAVITFVLADTAEGVAPGGPVDDAEDRLPPSAETVTNTHQKIVETLRHLLVNGGSGNVTADTITAGCDTNGNMATFHITGTGFALLIRPTENGGDGITVVAIEERSDLIM